MQISVEILILILAFFSMEGIAWLSHKYIMHGVGWKIHRDHHQPQHGPFQTNDLFFLLFAIPAAVAIFFGFKANYHWLIFLGIGISLYGLVYFLIHDVFIHQRFSWFKRIDNAYLRAVRKAHRVHHKSQLKHGSECFGMLLVPKKYLLQAKSK